MISYTVMSSTILSIALVKSSLARSASYNGVKRSNWNWTSVKAFCADLTLLTDATNSEQRDLQPVVRAAVTAVAAAPCLPYRRPQTAWKASVSLVYNARYVMSLSNGAYTADQHVSRRHASTSGHMDSTHSSLSVF